MTILLFVPSSLSCSLDKPVIRLPLISLVHTPHLRALPLYLLFPFLFNVPWPLQGVQHRSIVNSVTACSMTFRGLLGFLSLTITVWLHFLWSWIGFFFLQWCRRWYFQPDWGALRQYPFGTSALLLIENFQFLRYFSFVLGYRVSLRSCGYHLLLLFDGAKRSADTFLLFWASSFSLPPPGHICRSGLFHD